MTQNLHRVAVKYFPIWLPDTGLRAIVKYVGTTMRSRRAEYECEFPGKVSAVRIND